MNSLNEALGENVRQRLKEALQSKYKSNHWWGYKAKVSEIIENELENGRESPGFFRELIDTTTTKGYGTIVLTPEEIKANLNRDVGVYGAKTITFTSPFLIQRGPKLVEVKASTQKPITCTEHIYPMI